MPSTISNPRTAAALVAFVAGILVLYVYLSGTTNAKTSQLFTGHEKHAIALSDAAKLTSNFRETSAPNAILGEFFGRDAVKGLLDQKECAGVRVYYGKKDDGTPVIVLVGADASGRDMYAGIVLETGFPCPPLCDDDSPLSHAPQLAVK